MENVQNKNKAIMECEEMTRRKILRIHDEKCNGCGLCIPACAEGALQIANGKVKLISDVYCDGLGACIEECPQGAISIEEREAAEFNREAAEERVKGRQPASSSVPHPEHAQSCPSIQAVHFGRKPTSKQNVDEAEKSGSLLNQWPVQLTLLPTNAPFLKNADLLISADCVPFAYSNFHKDFLMGRILVIGCPKLDDFEFYKKKLTEIFTRTNIRSVTVVNMEVPCCFGLYHLVKEALGASGKSLPLRQETISTKGEREAASTQGHL